MCRYGHKDLMILKTEVVELANQNVRKEQIGTVRIEAAARVAIYLSFMVLFEFYFVFA